MAIRRRVASAFVLQTTYVKLWVLVAMSIFYSAAVALLEFNVLHRDPDIRSDLHGLLGIVLGLLLVFRTTTAYDRWWEGRKLWGQLVNDMRNLGIKARSLSLVPVTETHELGKLLITFAYLLKEHLRGQTKLQQNNSFLIDKLDVGHVPSYLAGQVIEKLQSWKTKGWLDGWSFLWLDSHARSLLDVCGGCERIRSTPLSRSYVGFIRQCIALYLITLPWGLIHDFRFWTVPAMALIAYFMIGLEQIAEDIEEPFGYGVEDLALEQYCRTIETSVGEILAMCRKPVD